MSVKRIINLEGGNSLACDIDRLAFTTYFCTGSGKHRVVCYFPEEGLEEHYILKTKDSLSDADRYLHSIVESIYDL